MRVQRVVMPGSGRESWTLLGDDLRPVEPVERFLAYPAAIEKSPNTMPAFWPALGQRRAGGCAREYPRLHAAAAQDAQDVQR
jgi:hypothetical protein